LRPTTPSYGGSSPTYGSTWGRLRAYSICPPRCSLPLIAASFRSCKIGVAGRPSSAPSRTVRRPFSPLSAYRTVVARRSGLAGRINTPPVP
jgi:hypothetical protein